jgi:hypothetical protein
MQRLLDDPHALKPLPPVTLSDVERPMPLPVAEAPDDQAGNGHQVAGDPAQVASVQQGPPPAPDLGPPTHPVPLAIAGEGNRPWLPSELQPPADEPLGPPPAPPAPKGAPTPDHSSRPSEWGRAVFEPEADNGQASRFGRRR